MLSKLAQLFGFGTKQPTQGTPVPTIEVAPALAPIVEQAPVKKKRTFVKRNETKKPAAKAVAKPAANKAAPAVKKTTTTPRKTVKK